MALQLEELYPELALPRDSSSPVPRAAFVPALLLDRDFSHSSSGCPASPRRRSQLPTVSAPCFTPALSPAFCARRLWRVHCSGPGPSFLAQCWDRRPGPAGRSEHAHWLKITARPRSRARPSRLLPPTRWAGLARATPRPPVPSPCGTVLPPLPEVGRRWSDAASGLFETFCSSCENPERKSFRAAERRRTSRAALGGLAGHAQSAGPLQLAESEARALGL